MQHTATTARPLDRPPAAPAGQEPLPTLPLTTGLPVNVPSDQLWRDAIQATRRAASAAAELRLALQASRQAAVEDRPA